MRSLLVKSLSGIIIHFTPLVSQYNNIGEHGHWTSCRMTLDVQYMTQSLFYWCCIVTRLVFPLSDVTNSKHKLRPFSMSQTMYSNDHVYTQVQNSWSNLTVSWVQCLLKIGKYIAKFKVYWTYPVTQHR